MRNLAIVKRDFPKGSPSGGCCNAVATKLGPSRSGSGSTPVPGCNCPASTPDKPSSRRSPAENVTSLVAKAIGCFHVPLSQPTLGPGADAGHQTRGRVCSPVPRLSEMISERCYNAKLA